MPKKGDDMEAVTANAGMDHVAVAGVYTPAGGVAVSVSVIVDRNVELIAPGESGVVEWRTVLTLLKSEITKPRRSDAVVVGSENFSVDRVLDDDGYLIRVVVR